MGDNNAIELDKGGINKKMENTDKKTTEKYAALCDATDKIAANCNYILALLQAVAVKVLSVVASLLLLCVYKGAGAWYH